MLTKSQYPSYKSSNSAFTNTRRAPPPKTKVLNLKENPAGNTSSIRKTAAVLTSITSLGFGTKYVVDNDLDVKAFFGKVVEWGSDTFIPPNTKSGNSLALTVGSLLAIGIASAAYYKFKRPQNFKNPFNKIANFNPKTSTQNKPTYTSPKKPINKIEQSTPKKTTTINQSPNKSPYIPSGIANTSKSVESSPTSPPQNVFGIQLKPSQPILTQKDKIDLENQERNKRIEACKQLPRKELKKSAEAVNLLHSNDHLDNTSENPEVIKTQWLDQFKVLHNETNTTKLSKILLEAVLNASDDEFELYAKNETFWTQITCPRLNKAAIHALSVKQVELLVSFTMSEILVNRSFQLNKLLSCLSDYEITDEKSKELFSSKLKVIAGCGHQDLDEFVLGLASSKLGKEAEKTFAKIRKKGKDLLAKKYKKDSLAFQASQLKNTPQKDSKEKPNTTPTLALPWK